MTVKSFAAAAVIFASSFVGYPARVCAEPGAAKAAKQPAELSGVESTKSIMDAIFAPMSRILPKSLSDTDFTGASNRQSIQADMDQLAENAKLLEKHAHGKNRNFEFVARSLARDATNVRRWYSRGNFEEARFTLHNMTENCISCHSTLPSPTSSTFKGASGFFKDIDVTRFPMLERAHLQVMTRQYEDALKSYESYLEAATMQPTVALASGAFVDYLKVAICAEKDLKRPLATLNKLSKSLPPGSRGQELIKQWTQLLNSKIDLKKSDKSVLDQAKKLIQQGQEKMEYPGDRAALMQYVVAQSLLLNFINARQDKDAMVAEAYYYLGITESMLEHAFWLSKADFYLESAIRLAPSSKVAKKAFAMLEENMVLGFTGSAGTHLPDDIVSLLNELRTIISENQ